MHLQNLVTGQWLHRDVQGVNSPMITWMLNGADTFTGNISPPRADLLDSTGNPITKVWQTACYLEEANEIKFGGILTNQTMDGPQLGFTFTGFGGYPNGMIYEGPVYKKTNIDAAEVVRYLWSWLQSQPNGDLHVQVDAKNTGVLLGTQPQSGNPVSTHMIDDRPVGSNVLYGDDVQNFKKGMTILVGATQEQLTVKKVIPRAIIGGNVATLGTIELVTPTRMFHKDRALIIQLLPRIAFELDWWNGTDIGQEISSIQADAIFDWKERHAWANAARSEVDHFLDFQVPRRGIKQERLRFAEGENMIVPAQVSQDGANFANVIVGTGAGQGSAMVRSTVADVRDRLRRTQVYQDQTVKTVARMTSKARRVLQSTSRIDTPAQVTVINHRNAPFGSFQPGDDILITMATGWRSGQVWCRITQMAQDPNTSQISLTLLRSDSFTYMAQSGQAGTM